jgi:hypothetical protein
MTAPVSGNSGVGPAAYLKPANRAAWREDMLNQALKKVRQVQAEMTPEPQAGQPEFKGRLINVTV